jgi:hypothetical protein
MKSGGCVSQECKGLASAMRAGLVGAVWWRACRFEQQRSEGDGEGGRCQAHADAPRQLLPPGARLVLSSVPRHYWTTTRGPCCFRPGSMRVPQSGGAVKCICGGGWGRGEVKRERRQSSSCGHRAVIFGSWQTSHDPTPSQTIRKGP